ncbi:glycosyltransferase family protein [Actinokineospora bangkokensis]|uniref:glycosyltransferase n=1 Tax=Actinokineospora bangkokensis TaxID=1193682 RepID=UPI000A8AAC31|nr:glycosyltransferase [Actinokineospora bangkokensis]
MPTSARPLRVASVPGDHPYVHHLSPATGGGSVRRLADVPVPGAAPGQWWPPGMLRPEWVLAHADDFDVLHVHFGFDDSSPEGLAALVAALRSVRRPLVMTVHDLHNPHFTDQRAHSAALDVLVPAAAAVMTLTPGAAAEIASRWGRAAVVVPHPHVVPVPWLDKPRRAHSGFVVGVHAKSLRANSDPLGVVEQLRGAARDLPGVTIRVDAHDDPQGRAVARALAGQDVDLRVHPRFSDDELWEYLSALDVSVLPYRFGTHSGWLEACYDLGTTALVPSCGHYAQQAPCLVYRWDAAPGDADSVRSALRSAWESPPRWRATAADRLRQRDIVAATHERVYRDVIASTGAVLGLAGRAG